MKNVSFKLNVPEIKNKFNALFSVANRSCVLPILQGIRVVQNGNLKFIATDLENAVFVTMEAQGKEEFDFCIDSKSIEPFFKDSTEEYLDVTGTENRVSLKSGEFSVFVRLDDSVEFPKSRVFGEGISLKINSKELCTLFEQAIRFVSNDDFRPAMTGVNISDWNGSLYVLATDAHRAFYKPIMPTPENLKGLSVIIPRKSVGLFIEMFRNEDIEIKIEKNCIYFVGKDKELVSRLIDCRYPDFSKIFPACPLSFSLQRKQFNSFLKVAQHFTSRSTHQLRLKINTESVYFEGGDLDEGNEFNSRLPIYNVSANFPEISFAVNLKLIKEVLLVHKKDKYVKFEHTGHPSKGFIIDGCVLMMPLMTNG